MRESVIRIATIVDSTASGNSGTAVETTRGQSSYEVSEKCRISMNITALVGTAPLIDMDVIGIVNGVEFIVGSFTQAVAGASKQSIVIDQCPIQLKAAWVVGGTVTDFDATLDATRM